MGFFRFKLGVYHPQRNIFLGSRDGGGPPLAVSVARCFFVRRDFNGYIPAGWTNSVILLIMMVMVQMTMMMLMTTVRGLLIRCTSIPTSTSTHDK